MSRRPVLVLANKLDDPRRDLEALEFHRLGLGDPIPISAVHGHGTGDLLDEIVGRLPGRAERPVGEEAIKVAILGRPNVGKSSLLNALVGRERVIVSEVPGTTRDSIDTVLARDETTFVLVDTAGLRRKRKQRQGIEYYSELRALEAAERADVALVLVDASQGVVDQDLAVADVARKAQCATIVVLSKWDVTEVRIEDVRPEIATRLRQRPPLIAVSAHTGRGLERLLDMIEELFVRYAGRITTAELNRALQELREARQPPGRRGRRLNLLYGTQVTLASAAVPVLRERPRAGHARLRLLGRERAARALRARGRARLDRLRHVRDEDRRRRRGLVGNGVRVPPARQRPRRDARSARSGTGRRDGRDGAEPALRARRPTSTASRRRRSPTRPSRTPSSSSSPCRAACSARSSRAFRATRRS